MRACTIVARNYLPHARVLARSFREHNSGDFTALIIDAERSAVFADEQFEVVTPVEIGFEATEFRRMAAIYDVMELATAVKPMLLKRLLERGPAVTYLDPDIEIFDALEDIDVLAQEHGTVLTPHTLDPLPHDHSEPGEKTLLLAGQFNLGFVAVGRKSEPFLDWWQQRVARDCRVEPSRGIFVDQRWVDFVPALFEHHVLRARGMNVAYWNLETRELEATPKGYTVDGEPLRLFHFSGFDARTPYLLSKFLGRSPAILLSDEPGLAQICDEYAEKLFEAGFETDSQSPYALDRMRNGVAINHRMRKLYREQLFAAEHNGESEPPNPFDDDGTTFLAWLNEKTDPFARDVGLTRYLADLHRSRPDLQRSFPDPWWTDAESFAAWIHSDGRAQDSIPFELLPPPLSTDEREPAAPLIRGVNVAGYFGAVSGTGSAARHLVAGLDGAGVEHSTINYDKTISRQQHAFGAKSSEPMFDINLICVNADELPRFVHDIGPALFQGRHSIGFWAWELEDFPSSFHGSFDILNEVWANSNFTREAIAKATSKPVYTVPLGVAVPETVEPLERDRFDIPAGFMFLFMFDFLSVTERKNPAAVIEAFVKAFDPSEGPVLVLKCINAESDLRALERLRFLAGNRPDIVILDQYFTGDDRHGLLAACDCYISLHRSEGFGLTMAEAMAHGKPVIATAYSGNLDFMNEANSFLVPYRSTMVPTGQDPYPKGAVWAEPDLDAAGSLMRHVYEDGDSARAKAQRGKLDILQDHSVAATSAFMRQRLNDIWLARGAVSSAPVPAVTSTDDQPDSLVRARRWLSEGPTNPIQAPSRVGGAGIFVRRLLYRALRPYIVRQREFEQAVVDAVGELRGSLRAESAQRLRDSHHVEEQLREELRALHAAAEPGTEGSDSRVSRLARSLDVVGDDLKKTNDHVIDVSESSERTRQQLERLSAELHSRPYLADEAALSTTGENGKPILGYTAPDAAPEGEGAYGAFEEIFRGTEEFIRDRQGVYVYLVADHEPLVDLGCGRGEFLDLLAELGMDATGVDSDAGMVDRCRQKGHEVEHADALEYLERLEDGSLGSIFASQLIEHLAHDELMGLFDVSRRKLNDNGLLICETVNPHSVSALKSFWVDLTHRSPIFPEVALALARINGFRAARIIFPNGTGTLDDDLREQGEYALIATSSPDLPQGARKYATAQ